MKDWYLFLLLVLTFILSGCVPPQLRQGWVSETGTAFNGGGQDAVTISLPFEEGYVSLCTQGAGGAYSHSATSTRYDVDLDTPNDVNDEVFAPISGTVYVHDEHPGTGFGMHVNIDLNDGTYIVLGHLSSVFVENGSEVASGQLIGFEGTTGNSNGDHVHLGRHAGDAEQDAIHGESIAGLYIYAEDTTSGLVTGRSTEELVCGLTTGRRYRSQLQVNQWHPDGSLIKFASTTTIFRIENGQTHPFPSEEDFWQNNYDFSDVALVPESELACYEVGMSVSGENFAYGAYDGTNVWLLRSEGGVYIAERVPISHWQNILQSWGASQYALDDLLTVDGFPVPFSAFEQRGLAVFRDGTLVREQTNPTVYMISGGVAMPFDEWNTVLLAGYQATDIQWVEDGVVEAVQGFVGSCALNAYCIGHEDLVTCGGAEESANLSSLVGSPPAGTSGPTGDTGTLTDTGTIISPPLPNSCDADGDGFFAAACGGTDCRDNDAAMFPGNPEICDYKDNDCDGIDDDGVATVYYLDADGDGYGNPNESRNGCSLPNGYSATGDDCDDQNVFVNPHLQDVWDLRDNDCDGLVDESGLLVLNRHHRAYAYNDWEHRVSESVLPTPWNTDGHTLSLYPVNLCSDLSYQPFDDCIEQDGGKTIRLQGDYELMAMAQCSGELDGYHLSLLLEEGGGEYAVYHAHANFACERIGYTFADERTRLARGVAVPVYRHRSPPMTAGGPARTGVADNMWSIIPCEYDHACTVGVPADYDYDEHALVWWAPDGSN